LHFNCLYLREQYSLWTTANQLLEGVEVTGSLVELLMNEALVDFEQKKVICSS